MPTYEYRCERGHKVDLFFPLSEWPHPPVVCEQCSDRLTPMRRAVSSKPLAPAVMHEHWNTSVGKPISSQRQFDDELKRAAEDQYHSTGLESEFVSVDPTDAETLGAETD